MEQLIRICIVLGLASPALLRAQPSDTWIKENFLLEVHVIDDFIERFNGEVDQQVLDKWTELFQKKDIARKDVLYSLFNLRSTQWEKEQLAAFADQITDRQCPVFLDFEADGWYATANCLVRFQEKTYQTGLVLKIRKDPRSGGLEWVVVSMLFPEIFSEYCADRLPFAKKNRTLFLSPMSHGANFGGLKRIFADRVNFVDCLDNPAGNILLNTLAWEVYHGDFELLNVASVDYHFFQIPGWVFVVKQVAREDFNTGWLISELYPVLPHDVANYKRECLNLK